MLIKKMLQAFYVLCLFIPAQVYGVDDDICHTPDLADSYLLAISWQPSFCETHKNLMECKEMQRTHANDPKNGPSFTLHGLWPNKNECGKEYNFCGENEVLELSDDVLRKLTRVMPNVKFGGDLHQREWVKHGTCQTKFTADEYFNMAIALVNDFSSSEVVNDFMTKYMGKRVAKKDLIAALEKGFGESFVENVTLQCDKKILTEIRVELPTNFSAGDTLSILTKQSSGKGLNSGSCGITFVIDQWGKSIQTELRS